MLKKITMLLFAVALTSTAFAQKDYDYKKFRVDLGGGVAIPNGGAGVLFYVEPKYAVHPDFSVGVRLLNALIAKKINDNTADVSSNISFLLTGDYYFTSTTARPYIGAGLGLFHNAGLATTSSYTNSGGNTTITSNYSVPSSNNFGAMIRGGVDVVHLRIGLEYNFVPSTTAQNGSNNNADFRVQNSYFGITFGGYFGGGKLK